METLTYIATQSESREESLENNESLIQPCDLDDSSDPSDISGSPHPVFMNDLILENIFSFLDLEDFKTCRLVCRKWKSVGEAHFKSKVQIYFNFNKPYTEVDLRVFFQNAQIEFPFRSLKFKGPLPLSTSNLTSFFATEAKFITHLILKNINLAEEDLSINLNRSYLAEYNFTHIVSGIENLTSLEIQRKEGGTRLNLSLVSLRRIKYIHLENCSIELSETTIAPIELRLRSVKYCLDNLPVKLVRLNDFVEVDLLETLVIIHPRSRESTLALDLAGSVTLKHLKCLGVRICNIAMSSWTVNALDIYFGQYIERSNMKIEKLHLRYSKFDLLCLPPTVIKLSLGCETTLVGTELGNVSLPNITYLELLDNDVVKIHFPYLSTTFCNLRELRLQHYAYKDVCKIDVNQIPKSVEILIFGNSSFRFVGEEIFSLKSLIIEEDFEYNLQFIVNVTKHFFPKMLKAEVHIDTLNPCNRVIDLQSLLNTSIPRIMLGEVHSDHLAYLESFPSFEAIGITGQIVNSNSSKITFSFFKLD